MGHTFTLVEKFDSYGNVYYVVIDFNTGNPVNVTEETKRTQLFETLRDFGQVCGEFEVLQ